MENKCIIKKKAQVEIIKILDMKPSSFWKHI